MITAAQIRLIWAKYYELKTLDDRVMPHTDRERMRGLLKSVLRHEVPERGDMFAWLTKTNSREVSR